MGKGLIWLGEKIVSLWCSMQCKWNKGMLALMFQVGDCPNKLCTCKN